MMRKTIGILLAAAIVALLVVVVSHRDRYRSMVFDTDEGVVPLRRATGALRPAADPLPADPLPADDDAPTLR